MKQLVETLASHLKGYRDERTGIAWIEDGSVGLGYSLHPNIDATGSIRGMRDRGYWGKKDRCVRSHGFIYNIDRYVSEDKPEINEWLLRHCRCGGNHGTQS